MKKIIGLDLGTTSIGWAVVNEKETVNEESSIYNPQNEALRRRKTKR